MSQHSFLYRRFAQKSYLLLSVLCVISLVATFFFFRSFNPFTQTVFVSSHPSPTPLQPPQTFILLGDTGSGNENQRAVAQAISSYCAQKNCIAAFIAGDVFYEEGVTSVKDIQFRVKFEEMYQDTNIPFYIAFGNHDYLGCESCYLDYTQYSSKWKMPARYYHQTFDPQIHMYVIDTENLDRDQQAWLIDQLKQHPSDWNIVVGHRPLVSYEETKIDEQWNGRKELGEIICNDAQLYLSGHAHLVEDNKQLEGCLVHLLVSGGGGAHMRKAAVPNESAFILEKNGFIGFTIQGSVTTYEFVDAMGGVVHTGKIVLE